LVRRVRPVSADTEQLKIKAASRLTIIAEPRKDFFISMLVRDINVNAAIIDLVDNCVDGAIRCRKNKPFNDLSVHIEVTRDRFVIRDNCGGISETLARKYAFNFGRSPGDPTVEHSVGQFGVGMKRALFKLGKKFIIQSASAKSTFTVEVDVDQWREAKDWTFQFKKLETAVNPASEQGTTITVSPLNEGVANYFQVPENVNNLRTEIGERHQMSIDRGMAVVLNGVHVKPVYAKLLASRKLKPAYYEKKYPVPYAPKAAKVTVKIWAGIGRSGSADAQDAGWYVFCNQRMILRADQSTSTGWGQVQKIYEKNIQEKAYREKIPKYHMQFRWFRGYVMFDSNDGTFLPWNTTKNGLEEESWIYPTVKLQMMTLMRPVIDFLNRIDEEGEGQGGDTGPLHAAVNEATPVLLSKVTYSGRFVAPKTLPTPPRWARISYKKPTKDIEWAQQKLKARSRTEVGEKTFEYYLKMEKD